MVSYIHGTPHSKASEEITTHRDADKTPTKKKTLMKDERRQKTLENLCTHFARKHMVRTIEKMYIFR